MVATVSRKLVRVKKLCRRQLLARNSVRISIRTPHILFIDLLLPLIPQVSNLQQCWCTWHKLHKLMACSNYQYCVRQPASSQYCCRLPESSYSPSQYWSHGHMTGGSWRIWRCSLKLASVCCKHLTVTSHSWCCRVHRHFVMTTITHHCSIAFCKVTVQTLTIAPALLEHRACS